jgi:uncharacterized lipoprotein YmbA
MSRGWLNARVSLPALLAMSLAAGLAGCGRSPPTQFFTLAPVRPDRPQRLLVGAPLQVRAVHIPAVLDRPERVVGRSPQRLDILQTQQWGAPLADMIRRVLSEDLAARLPAGMVLMADAPQTPHTRGVVVDIQEFQPDAGGRVVLGAGWVLLGAQGGQGDRGQSRGQSAAAATRADQRLRLHIDAGSGADAQVRAMSTLLGRLADAIAASVR